MQNKIMLLLVSVFIFSNSFSQTKKSSQPVTLTKDQASEIKKAASGFYGDKNYKEALPRYLQLVNNDSENWEFNYRLGLCYLNTAGDKSRAIEYLIRASAKKDTPKDVNFYLANALLSAGELDDAQENYEKYKELNNGKINAKFNVDNHIEWCFHAKELMKTPVEVKFTNAGKQVNSPTADYRPVCDAEGSMILFTSNRKGNMGGLPDGTGEFISDIYYTTFDTAFSKAKSTGPMVCTEMYDESIFLNANGDVMLVYREGGDAQSPVYITEAAGKAWSKIVPFAEDAKTGDKIDGASLSPDEKTLYFAAELKGGKGGKDIWYTFKNEKGEWSTPRNCGDGINTKFDEINPYVFADGKTIFFASEGHNSMGGFDIFSSTRTDESQDWSAGENLGYPLNTFDDDKYFCINATGHTGYVSRWQKDAIGETDIYRFVVKQALVKNKSTLFKAILQKADGTPAKDALCSITMNSTGESFGGVIKSNPNTGKILAALPPGVYKLKVKGQKSGRLDVDFTITGDEKAGKLEKTFKLTPIMKEPK